MPITLRLILLILALVIFVVAALGIRHPKCDLIAAGLALWVLASIFG